jgi:hypothetical protein
MGAWWLVFGIVGVTHPRSFHPPWVWWAWIAFGVLNLGWFATYRLVWLPRRQQERDS